MDLDPEPWKRAESHKNTSCVQPNACIMKIETFWDFELIILIIFAYLCMQVLHETAKIWGHQSVRQGSCRMSLSLQTVARQVAILPKCERILEQQPLHLPGTTQTSGRVMNNVEYVFRRHHLPWKFWMIEYCLKMFWYYVLNIKDCQGGISTFSQLEKTLWKWNMSVSSSAGGKMGPDGSKQDRCCALSPFK